MSSAQKTAPAPEPAAESSSCASKKLTGASLDAAIQYLVAQGALPADLRHTYDGDLVTTVYLRDQLRAALLHHGLLNLATLEDTLRVPQRHCDAIVKALLDVEDEQVAIVDMYLARRDALVQLRETMAVDIEAAGVVSVETLASRHRVATSLVYTLLTGEAVGSGIVNSEEDQEAEIAVLEVLHRRIGRDSVDTNLFYAREVDERTRTLLADVLQTDTPVDVSAVMAPLGSPRGVWQAAVRALLASGAVRGQLHGDQFVPSAYGDRRAATLRAQLAVTGYLSIRDADALAELEHGAAAASKAGSAATFPRDEGTASASSGSGGPPEAAPATLRDTVRLVTVVVSAAAIEAAHATLESALGDAMAMAAHRGASENLGPGTAGISCWVRVSEAARKYPETLAGLADDARDAAALAGALAAMRNRGYVPCAEGDCIKYLVGEDYLSNRAVLCSAASRVASGAILATDSSKKGSSVGVDVTRDQVGRALGKHLPPPLCRVIVPEVHARVAQDVNLQRALRLDPQRALIHSASRMSVYCEDGLDKLQDAGTSVGASADAISGLKRILSRHLLLTVGGEVVDALMTFVDADSRPEIEQMLRQVCASKVRRGRCCRDIFLGLSKLEDHARHHLIYS